MSRCRVSLLVRSVALALIPIAPLLADSSGAPRVETRAQDLSFEERVEYQRRIEMVYWRHRTDSVASTAPRGSFEEVVPEAVIRAKVENTLKKSQALERYAYRPVTGEQLQAEMNRMARQTRLPGRLRELFAVLDHDPYVIAEVLARPVLVDRLLRSRWNGDNGLGAGHGESEAFDTWWADVSREFEASGGVGEAPPSPPEGGYGEPGVDGGMCTRDTWEFIEPGIPDPGDDGPPVWTGSEMLFYTGQAGWRYDPATDTWTRISADGAPGITGHTAVWTGNEMIVWGGNLAGSHTNVGGRYDPVTDAWTSTSTGAGVPTARDQHVAVWTGTEMIVWGGVDIDETDTGGRYDPATDSWTPTSTGANVPAGREQHTAVWSGTEMIVWGGQYCDGGGCPELNTGGRYDPATDTWLPTSTGTNVPSARSFHAAVWTGSEMIVWGGREPGFTVINTGGRYDPATDTWLPTSTGADVPSPRLLHTAVWTGSMMIVWGGQSPAGSELDTGARYDPGTDSWSPTSTGSGVPAARDYHWSIWSGSEMIVFGGSTAAGGTNEGSRYDPGTDSWSPTRTDSDVPTARSNHVAVWTGAEMIAWGGADHPVWFQSGSRYDPALATWTPTSEGANVPTGRRYAAAVWTGTEMIVWGGNTEAGTTNTGGRYDPVSDTWIPTSTGAGVPDPRQEHTAVWTGTEMIVWGGWTTTQTNTGGRYNPATDSWSPTSVGKDVPEGRTTHAAVWTGTEMIIWGGYVDASPHRTDTGGRYDPSRDRWTPTSIGANTPSPRWGHSGVWSGTEMIVWGGREAGSPFYTNTGGRYDPVTDAWTPTSTSSGTPTARSYQAAVWTGSKMIVWSGTDGEYLRTGGRYDPGTDAWEPTGVDEDTPPGRRYGGAVWSGTDDERLIVWAGSSSNPTATGGLYCLAGCFAPGPAASLDFLEDGVTLAWPSQSGAVTYDVVKGNLIALRSGGGDFANSITACLENDGTDEQAEDAETPATGEGFYYLVRGIGCEALVGTYDSGGAGQQGGRDAGIAGSANACP